MNQEFKVIYSKPLKFLIFLCLLNGCFFTLLSVSSLMNIDLLPNLQEELPEAAWARLAYALMGILVVLVISWEYTWFRVDGAGFWIRRLLGPRRWVPWASVAGMRSPENRGLNRVLFGKTTKTIEYVSGSGRKRELELYMGMRNADRFALLIEDELIKRKA